MSFVERNKTWILPALLVGAAGVVWMNVRTFSDAPAPVTVPPPRDLPATAEAAPAPAPPVTQGALEGNLWDDLLALAVVPADLGDRGPFEQRALTTLTPAQLAGDDASAPLARPGLEPGRPLRSAEPVSGAQAVSAPQPDFLIEGPAGSRVWFEGRGYGQGQALRDQPFRVQSIEFDPAPLVRLKGSRGLATRSTRPVVPTSKELP